MKKIFVFLIIAIVVTLNTNAQRVSTQQFMVRKITFKATDQIVPISGITVEINKAKFRSNNIGQFTANIPVSKDLGFYISNITAPGYIVSIPEDLSKKIYLSSNQCVIVLADINAVKAERNRIYNNNKAAMAKQEERLKAEVKKNQDLLNKIEKQESEYTLLLAELEKTKQQLESFNNAKPNLEEKIDSLSDYLALVDYASLDPKEQTRLEKEKDGEWIGAIVDEVISKLETNFTTKHSNELNEFEKTIEDISNDYYHKFIKGNKPFAINYFTYHYRGYLLASVSSLRKKKDKVLDRILDKIIEEDMNEILKKHINNCRNKWKVEDSKTDSEKKIQKSHKTLESAKEDFLSWAMYPDREYALLQVNKPHWNYPNTADTGIINTIKKVYSNEYMQCKDAADKFVEKYKDITKEELHIFADESARFKILLETNVAIEEKIKELGNMFSITYDAFKDDIITFAAEESLGLLRNKYNELIDNNIKEVMNSTFESIESKIRPITEEKHHSNTLIWDSDNKIEEYNDEYTKLKKEYPEYTSFLYSIVMQFLQPIIKKYDCDEALYVWKSSMEEDVSKFCFSAIRKYQDKISYIPNVEGSNDKCIDIVRAITVIEEEKIITNHNERLKNLKEAKTKVEQTALADMKSNKKRFDREEDIIAFLATHKFINKESEISSWYDSKITKWYIDFGYGESYYDISYTIMEWNSNSAKLKLKIDRGGIPIIVNIQLNSTSASYSESSGGETRKFSVTDK